VEIQAEIIDRPSLKSLARLMCVSKLWSSVIKETTCRRLLEELRRRLHRLNEIYWSLLSLYDVVKRFPVDADELYCDHLSGMLDEMRSLAACNDDIHREYEEGVDPLRDYVDQAARYCNRLLDIINGFVDIDDKVEKIADKCLNWRNRLIVPTRNSNKEEACTIDYSGLFLH